MAQPAYYLDERMRAFSSRPSRTTISGRASTSAARVWKLTIQARSKYCPRTTAFETKASPEVWMRSRSASLSAFRYASAGS